MKSYIGKVTMDLWFPKYKIDKQSEDKRRGITRTSRGREVEKIDMSPEQEGLKWLSGDLSRRTYGKGVKKS